MGMVAGKSFQPPAASDCASIVARSQVHHLSSFTELQVRAAHWRGRLAVTKEGLVQAS